jgi:hypothetical protein
MKMNWTGMRIGVTVLARSVSLLAIPTLLEAQRVVKISRVGWLEVPPSLLSRADEVIE